ncbi:F-box/FBD/LRR-repeat protein-like protein [Tanacetum coccineum]
MELVHGELIASKCEAKDVISSMPDNVITKILNWMPLRDAVSTGPITNFDLDIPEYILFDDEDVNHWLSVLSRKGIKKLNIIKLSYPRFKRCTFGDLIARCPLLEDLRICDNESVDYVVVAEIAKHGYLKTLDLSLCVLESIFHLADLPKLEKLDLGFRSCEFLADACVRNKVATTFLSLKTLHLFIVDFNDDLMAKYGSNVPLRANSDYNTMGMLHLRSVGFSCNNGSENEVRFIKSLLACSPLLEKIKIHRSSQVFSGDKGKLMFATKLLKLPRASPSAEVDISWD